MIQHKEQQMKKFKPFMFPDSRRDIRLPGSFSIHANSSSTIKPGEILSPGGYRH